MKVSNGTDMVTPEEFAGVWVEAERKLIEKVVTNQSNLDSLNVGRPDAGKTTADRRQDQAGRQRQSGQKADAGV